MYAFSFINKDKINVVDGFVPLILVSAFLKIILFITEYQDVLDDNIFLLFYILHNCIKSLLSDHQYIDTQGSN